MTSFAIIHCVVPLELATGDSAEMRQTLGIAVLSGMHGVTAFGIFFTPVFYSVIRRFTERKTAATTSALPHREHESAATNGELTIASDGHAEQADTLPQPVH
jgi:hypothetical protein